MPTPKEKELELKHKALTKEHRRIRTALFALHLRIFAEPGSAYTHKLAIAALKEHFAAQEKKSGHGQETPLPDSADSPLTIPWHCGLRPTFFDDFDDAKP
jgi:hypothetical protein